MAIQEGKIDGDGFTFSTVQHTKKGDVKVTWQGTLEGEQISGRRTRDRTKRGVLNRSSSHALWRHCKLDSHPDILCTCCVLAFGTRRLTALDSVGSLKMNVWILCSNSKLINALRVESSY